MDKMIAYAGEDQGVISWLFYRRSGNFLARILPMILPRLERKYRFRTNPLYKSPINNAYCDKLTRPSDQESIALANTTRWGFINPEPLIPRFLPGGIPLFALALPCGAPDQTQRLYQPEEQTYAQVSGQTHRIGSSFSLFGRWDGGRQHLVATIARIQPIGCTIGPPMAGIRDLNLYAAEIPLFLHTPHFSFSLGLRI